MHDYMGFVRGYSAMIPTNSVKPASAAVNSTLVLFGSKKRLFACSVKQFAYGPPNSRGRKSGDFGGAGSDLGPRNREFVAATSCLEEQQSRRPPRIFSNLELPLDRIAPGVVCQELLTHTQPTTLKPSHLNVLVFRL
jgi:hypothetical protein